MNSFDIAIFNQWKFSMKWPILITMILLFSSCHIQPQGVLTANKPLTLKRNTFIGRDQTITFPEGQYEAKVTFQRNRALFQVPGHKEIAFNIPEGRFGENISIIDLKTYETNNLFNLLGNVETNRYQDQPVQEVETCAYQRPVQFWACYYDNRGRRWCRWETRYETVWGQREVEYYFYHVDRHFSINFNHPENNETYGDFSGDFNQTDKRYTLVGRCY